MNLGIENEQLEFKKTTKELNEAMSDIVAILNKHQKGTLYFGINKDGDVVGFNVNESTLRDVSRKIFECIEPRIVPTIKKISLDNKDVIKVDFEGHNIPYNDRGIYYIRSADESRIMSTESLKNFIKSIASDDEWEMKLTSHTIDDIDEESLRDFYKKATQSNRLSLKEYDKEILLNMLNLSKDGHLNNAGYYLFGKDVNIKLKCAIFATDEKLKILDLKQYENNIYNLIDIALSYLSMNLKWRINFVQKAQREEKCEIDIDALREIITNSFAHAKYEYNSEHEIDIFPSFIQIYNPGPFPDGLTPEDFILSQRSSLARNKIILDCLFRSKNVEKEGSGFKRVDDISKKENLFYSYKLDNYGFYFIFKRSEEYKKPQEIDIKISENENKIYLLLKENNSLKIKDLVSLTSLSESTIKRILKSLSEKLLIERKGNNMNGCWIIK